jgi:hypothetical protein
MRRAESHRRIVEWRRSSTRLVGPIGPQHPFTHDYPGAKATVTLK